MNDKELLIEQLKTKLHITWNHSKTNEELALIVDNAENYMNHLLGAEIDYTAPGMGNLLFLAYCSYIWNDCESEFEEAYQKDILRAQAYYEVKSYEEKNTGVE